MTPEQLLRDHWGHGYRNPPAPALNALGAASPPRALGAFNGRAAGVSSPLTRVELGAPGDCWLWKGAKWGRNDAYGQCYLGEGRGRVMAHRAVYEALVGPIPEGLQLDHLCRNTLCCNPAHLEPVTNAENMRRRSAAQTHCKHGHLFDEANTAYKPNGTRKCRACQNAWKRAKRAATRGRAVVHPAPTVAVPQEPDRPSLTPEQILESHRIQLMIANHHYRHREV